MHSDQESIRKSIKTYWMIGAALFVFTGITVAVNQVHLAMINATVIAIGTARCTWLTATVIPVNTNSAAPTSQ